MWSTSTSIPRPSGSPNSSGSSSSSNHRGGGRGGSGRGGGGGGGGDSGRGSSHGVGTPYAASIGVGSNNLGFLNKKDMYRSKDLSLVKIESLPNTASEFRAWKNAFLTKIASIDQTGQDVILDWVTRAFNEGGVASSFGDSGLLPRLESHLESFLMESKHLKDEFGMKFQTYAESCQITRRAPRGRVFLFMLVQHFRLDLNRGSNLTQQALLDLQLDGYAPKDLEKFVECIE